MGRVVIGREAVEVEAGVAFAPESPGFRRGLGLKTAGHET
jgi:hypothetical protein